MLNLEAAGIETGDRGHIRANDRLETSADNVWVIGDVKGGPAFAHPTLVESLNNLFAGIE